MSIIVNGSIRSGTTWLMEVLAKHPEYHSIFEPDNFLKEAKELKIRYRYINPKNSNNEFHQFFKKLLYGEYYKMLYKQSSLKEKIFKIAINPTYVKNYKNSILKKPIIKFTRGHLFLPYLYHNFSTQNIFILRNPFFACYSAYKKGYLVSHFEELLDERQHELFNEYPHYYKKIQKSLELIDLKYLYSKECSKFTRQAHFFFINWAFVNSFLLEQYNNKNFNAFLISFEFAKKNPIKTFHDICEYLEIEFTDAMYNQIYNPSRSSQTVKHDLSFEILIEKYYGRELFEKLKNIIKIFDLEGIIDNSGLESFNLFSDVT